MKELTNESEKTENQETNAAPAGERLLDDTRASNPEPRRPETDRSDNGSGPEHESSSLFLNVMLGKPGDEQGKAKSAEKRPGGKSGDTPAQDLSKDSDSLSALAQLGDGIARNVSEFSSNITENTGSLSKLGTDAHKVASDLGSSLGKGISAALSDKTRNGSSSPKENLDPVSGSTSKDSVKTTLKGPDGTSKESDNSEKNAGTAKDLANADKNAIGEAKDSGSADKNALGTAKDSSNAAGKETAGTAKDSGSVPFGLGSKSGITGAGETSDSIKNVSAAIASGAADAAMNFKRVSEDADSGKALKGALRNMSDNSESGKRSDDGLGKALKAGLDNADNSDRVVRSKESMREFQNYIKQDKLGEGVSLSKTDLKNDCLREGHVVDRSIANEVSHKTADFSNLSPKSLDLNVSLNHQSPSEFHYTHQLATHNQVVDLYPSAKMMDAAVIAPMPSIQPFPKPPTSITIPRDETKTPSAAGEMIGSALKDIGQLHPTPSLDIGAFIPTTPHVSHVAPHTPDIHVGPDGKLPGITGIPNLPTDTTPGAGGQKYPTSILMVQPETPKPVGRTENPSVVINGNSGLDYLHKPQSSNIHNSQDNYQKDQADRKAQDDQHAKDQHAKEAQKLAEQKAQEKALQDRKAQEKIEHEQKQKPESTKQEQKISRSEETTNKIIDAAVKALHLGGVKESGGQEVHRLDQNGRKISEVERSSSHGLPVSQVLPLAHKEGGAGKATAVVEPGKLAENAAAIGLGKNNQNLNLHPDGKVLAQQALNPQLAQPQLVLRALEASAKGANLVFDHHPTNTSAKPIEAPAKGAGKIVGAIEAANKLANDINVRAAVKVGGQNQAANGAKVWTGDVLKIRPELKAAEGSVAARNRALTQLSANLGTKSFDNNSTANKSAINKGTGESNALTSNRRLAEEPRLLVNKFANVVSNANRVGDAAVAAAGVLPPGFVRAAGAESVKAGVPGTSNLAGNLAGLTKPFDASTAVNAATTTTGKGVDSGLKQFDSTIKRATESAHTGWQPAKFSENKKTITSKPLPPDRIDRSLLMTEFYDMPEISGMDASSEDTPAPVSNKSAFLLAFLLSMSGMSRKRSGVNLERLREQLAIDGDKQDAENAAMPVRTLHRRTHMVEFGDTLQSIAEKYYSDARVGWLIADLNANNVDEHGIDEKRVVELKTRQSLELPEALEVTEFLHSLPRDFDIDQRLVTLVSDTMVNLEILKQFLGPLLGGGQNQDTNNPSDQRKDLLGDFKILGADCA